MRMLNYKETHKLATLGINCTIRRLPS